MSLDMDLSNMSIDDLQTDFSKKDSILEPNIYKKAFEEYRNKGGSPIDAINTLSESYVGYPSMINLTADAVKIDGFNSTNCLNKALERLLIDGFDPQRFDKIFMRDNEPTALDWLDRLLQDLRWREKIYKLIDKYPTCQFLNYAIIRIADAGHEDELSGLKTPTTCLKVYSLILGNTLSDILDKDDVELEEKLPEIIRICCQREDTYLSALILLRKLSDEFDATPFVRIRQELERAAKKRDNLPMLNALHLFVNADASSREVKKLMKSIMSSPTIAFGDIAALERMYNSTNPPLAVHIRDYDLLVRFLEVLYAPKDGSVPRDEAVNGMIYLVAYATTINDSKPRAEQEDEVNRVRMVLKALHSKTTDAIRAGSIIGATRYILEAIKLPVGAMAVLLWCQYMATNTSYFDTYYQSKQTPDLFLFLDEIAERYPLLQPVIFDIVTECIKHKPTNFAPETWSNLQAMWIDRLLVLLRLHYQVPVMQYFQGVGKGLDNSLIVYFVQKVLAMVQSPYSVQFIENMVAIIESLMDNRESTRRISQSIITFFQRTLNENAGLSDPLREKITNIIIYCQ